MILSIEIREEKNANLKTRRFYDRVCFIISFAF